MTNKFSKATLWFIGISILVYVPLQFLVSVGLLNSFWNTIIRLGAVMAIVSIGLNLIYGFNGQFSLGQWGFYAIGAYSAADVTYRWTVNKSADGVIVLALATLLSGAAMLWLHKRLSKVRGLDPLSAFRISYGLEAVRSSRACISRSINSLQATWCGLRARACRALASATSTRPLRSSASARR